MAGFFFGRASGNPEKARVSIPTSPFRNIPMLTLDQCIDLCGLDNDDVEALARHASVPEIVAAQLACKMLQTREGRAQLDCILHQRLAEAAEGSAVCRQGACPPPASGSRKTCHPRPPTPTEGRPVQSAAGRPA
jgi:hypothetical protein